MGPNMSKVNKNTQFGPKSWFHGSKYDDKVPKICVGRHHFSTIFGHFWPFSGHQGIPSMVFSGLVVELRWNMMMSAKRIAKKCQIGHFWWIFKTIHPKMFKCVYLLTLIWHKFFSEISISSFSFQDITKILFATVSKYLGLKKYAQLFLIFWSPPKNFLC